MALLSIGEILATGDSLNLSSYIPYSALDYNATGEISGIAGSAIAGGVNSSVVSSIVSSMVSSKADQSAMEDCCSSMSSVVSSIQNDVSSISSYVSGLTGDYLEKSASSMFAPSGNYMSASESSSFYPMTGNPSGFLTGVDLSDYATTAYVDSSVSSKMDVTASGYLQPSGDYAYNSSLADYLPASSSGDFITSTAGLAPSGDYAYNSAVSSKLDASASSQFALSGDYAYNSSLSSLVAYSSLESADGVITAISGTAIGGGAGVEYSGVAPIVVDNAVHKVSADSVDLTFDSSMTSVLTDSQLIVGVSTAFTVPVQVVSSTALATGSGIVYVVQE